MATNVIIKETNQVTEEELKYIKELKANFIDKYKEIKTEKENIIKYEKLRNHLKSFHTNIKHDIQVPVLKHPTNETPLCLVNGFIYHTNEVFVPLSSSYYAKMSTTDAISFCNRKIEFIEENVSELEEQKKRFLERVVFMEESNLQLGQVEIIEEYPEDYEIAGSRRNKTKNDVKKVIKGG